MGIEEGSRKEGRNRAREEALQTYPNTLSDFHHHNDLTLPSVTNPQHLGHLLAKPGTWSVPTLSIDDTYLAATPQPSFSDQSTTSMAPFSQTRNMVCANSVHG
ncbi:hypothetical protein SLEP1_g33057 [Rubroshorea leprosula]|uniref:Uncharacterized protein n=1 Tax=Rubroshorea leprosula TaxID=152421 RepID=A0AAV5KFD6_9ROSI|nr:hypothetical protein SLEP1_g33057 [Rubroshorea leprosula]